MQSLQSALNADVQADGSFKVANIGAGQARMEVSNQWLARPADQRFLSLNDLAAHVRERAQNSKEMRIYSPEMEVVAPTPTTKEDLNKIWIEDKNGEIHNFTNWSFGQMAGLTNAPARYLRTLPTPIVADALNYGLRYNRALDAVKTYTSSNQLMAITGPDYGRIFDYEVVEAVQQFAGNGTGDTRWKVPGVMDWKTMIYDPNHPITNDTTTLFASDRDVFIFLVDDRNPITVGHLPNGEPDIMFRGVYVTNSEFGSSALKIGTFLLRGICCNRILWGVEGFQEITMRHSKYAPSRFIEEARPALVEYAEKSEVKLVEAVEKAKAAKLASKDEDMIHWLQGRKFTAKQAKNIMEAVEKEEGRPARTVWDVAQGITAVARSIPHQDERFAFELNAKKILDKVT